MQFEKRDQMCGVVLRFLIYSPTGNVCAFVMQCTQISIYLSLDLMINFLRVLDFADRAISPLSLNVELHSLIWYPMSKTKLTCPGYFRLCPVIESPFLAGVVWRVHWGHIVYESETGDYFKVSVGDILDIGRNDHEPGLVTKVNTALPPVREWRAVIA